MEACTIACTILWMSISGWQNRPDYFDTNDLTLIGDLAYIAQVDSEGFMEAYADSPADNIYDLCCALQKDGQAENWYALLKKHEELLMCELAPYEKYRLREAK